jgi:hypothetical protein
MTECNQIREKNKEGQIERAIAQLKVAEPPSELVSELEILCEPSAEVA